MITKIAHRVADKAVRFYMRRASEAEDRGDARLLILTLVFMREWAEDHGLDFRAAALAADRQASASGRTSS